MIMKAAILNDAKQLSIYEKPSLTLVREKL